MMCLYRRVYSGIKEGFSFLLACIRARGTTTGVETLITEIRSIQESPRTFLFFPHEPAAAFLYSIGLGARRRKLELSFLDSWIAKSERTSKIASSRRNFCIPPQRRCATPPKTKKLFLLPNLSFYLILFPPCP
ncbi:hypothetical protein VNO77_38926 [Canavalia gladiata]|uniref:Uncharacterized protein n=1 Tax=Canavalia gladiata TaxID=3824 RepID=A0AAN9PWP0_CANGL